MGISEEIRQRLIETFKTEQSEHVQTITQGLLTLEKTADSPLPDDVMAEIFRSAHSLKGSAKALGMTTIGALGHHLESVLLGIRESRLALSPDLFDLMYQALDAIEMLIERVSGGDTTPPASVLSLLVQLENMAVQAKEMATEEPAPPFAPVAAAAVEPEPISPTVPPFVTGNADETIRVSVQKLDGLMEQFSDLLAAKIQSEQRLNTMREMQALAQTWHKEWMSLREQYGRFTHVVTQNGQAGNRDVAALLSFMEKNQTHLRTFLQQANGLSRVATNDNMHLQLTIDALQEEIKRVRMLPLSTITLTFDRMVRDLARQQGKPIRFTGQGLETELDKRVLEQIKDPLIHILRNAVDHGIEKTAVRQQAGKSIEGQIRLHAAPLGQHIVIEVSDDGAGLNLDAIKKAAVSRGVVTADQVASMNERDIAFLIFHSGLSTSEMITDVSGRGVGMDVVRRNVEKLQGSLALDFTVGQGTTISMTLPLTLASTHGLLVRAGDQVFALPISSVERLLHVAPSDIVQAGDQDAVLYNGRPVGLARLADLLDLSPAPPGNARLIVVIIHVADKYLALVVDGLEGELEIVMKPMGRQLARVGGIAGGTLLGSGEVLLVLNPADLLKLAANPLSRPKVIGSLPVLADPKRVLVVDDSITTRILEKNILEAAGYQVLLATDGEEALTVLAEGPMPHLIVSDVAMPRLDGLGLTERVKQDSRYQEIPVILVTSLDSPADKARGIQVGADAYIVKNDFNQNNLLETIELLII